MASNHSGISAFSTIHRFHWVGFQTHFAKPCTKSESEFFRKWTRTSDDDDRGEKTEIAWPRFITRECESEGMIGDGMVMERVKEHQPDPMIYGYRMSRNARASQRAYYARTNLPDPMQFPSMRSPLDLNADSPRIQKGRIGAESNCEEMCSVRYNPFLVCTLV